MVVWSRASLVLTLVVVSAGCPKRMATPPDGSTAEVKQALEPGTVALDGKIVTVRWSDGDTFKIRDGELKGTGARLSGFNTLEDYGPVHSWGTWTRGELFALARAPEAFLSSRGWTCSSAGDKDRYGRILVDCPEVALALVGEGLAMVFAVEGAPEPALLEAQKKAQGEGKGMWAKGVPEIIVTSLHSVDEGRGYNRVVDTRSGISRVREHTERYESCQEVCEGPADGGSCMLYVPYDNRYKNKPDCLR